MTTFCVIDIDTWTSGWKLVFSSGWLAASVLYASAKLYITGKYLEEILSAFSNSPLAQTSSLVLKRQGLIAKTFLMSSTRGFFSPKLIKAGQISATDVENFPPHLKKILLADNLAAKTTFIWLVALCTMIATRGQFNCD